MKAITFHQPWATLLATGSSRYALHSWRTSHRGPLAIYAGRRWTEDTIDLCLHEDIRPLLARAGYDYLIQVPLGALVGIVQLVDCISVGSGDWQSFDAADPAVLYGPFYPENWAWVFAQARPLRKPLPYRGKMGIFSVPDRVLKGAE